MPKYLIISLVLIRQHHDDHFFLFEDLMCLKYVVYGKLLLLEYDEFRLILYIHN